MASGDEKVFVDVKDLENGEILFTDKDGSQQTYYPSHSVRLHVQALEVLTTLEASRNGAEPELSTRVLGSAALEDDSISVVGDSKSRAHKLKITFSAGNWKPAPLEATQGGFPNLLGELGGATLGFNRADWEIGNDDEWWASCYLPAHFIDALVADVRNGQIQGLTVSLSLRGLYTSTHSWEPVSARGDLFIRPDLRDNSIANPDMAQGYVWAVDFTSSVRLLRKPELEQPIQPKHTDELPEQGPDPVALAIASMASRVDQLRSTLKWIGGFIVVALLLVASR